MSGGGAHPKTLLLRANGTAELLDARENQLWASDSDEHFQDAWAGTMFLNESDVPQIMDYLIEAAGELTEPQAEELLIEEESFADGEADESEEEEGG